MVMLSSNSWLHKVRDIEISYLIKIIEGFVDKRKIKKAKILEIGSGDGYVIDKLAKLYPQFKFMGLEVNSSSYQNKSTKVKKLSDKQESYAEKMANEYWKRCRHQHYVFDSLLADCRAYLLTSQTDDDWKAIGNGLPPPSEIMNI